MTTNYQTPVAFILPIIHHMKIDLGILHLYTCAGTSCCCGNFFQKKPKAPSFQLWSG